MRLILDPTIFDLERAISLLVESGADVNATMRGGISALHLAASIGNLRGVRALIVAKAALNQVNYFGETALHYAAKSGNLEIASELLNAGAMIHCRDRDGKTPLEFARLCAADNVDLIALLKNHVSLKL